MTRHQSCAERQRKFGKLVTETDAFDWSIIFYMVAITVAGVAYSIWSAT